MGYFTSSFVSIGNGTFAREDVFDQGKQYRAFISLPGGLASPFLAAVENANEHGMRLVGGKGSDLDTFGTNQVYVLDSNDFPFYQAELCLQFHDKQGAEAVPPSYHNLR